MNPELILPGIFVVIILISIILIVKNYYSKNRQGDIVIYCDENLEE